MYLMIRYPAGAIVEGVVLAKRKNRMRVAAPGFADAIELKRSGSTWTTAEKESVELDFIMARSSDAALPAVKAMTFAHAN